MDQTKTLQAVAKLCRNKLPDKLAYSGSPKAEAMADATRMYSPRNKAEVIGQLQALAKVGLVTYRHDLRRVALTQAGLDQLQPTDEAKE